MTQSYLFSGGQDGKIRVWSLGTGEMIKEWGIPEHAMNDRDVTARCLRLTNHGFIATRRGVIEYWA
jgi:WD40 repeat protein